MALRKPPGRPTPPGTGHGIMKKRRIIRTGGRKGPPRRYRTSGSLPPVPRKLILYGTALLLIVLVLVIRKAAQTPRTLGDVKSELQQLVLGLADDRVYRDKSGWFTMQPPAGWKVESRPASRPYNVVFRSPNGPDIRIMAVAVDYTAFPRLLKRIDRIERELGIDMNLRLDRFKSYKAARRTATLHGEKVLAIDFLHGSVAHHIQFSAHPDVFDRYLPVVQDILETYEPLAPAEATEKPETVYGHRRSRIY